MGVCQQDNNLDPDLTVAENLHVFARYFSLPAKIARKRADELLSFMALEVIPTLKLTDQGLIDVEQFKPVKLFVE